ncbi:hypothetical protein [Clostridium saccharobutylicum]|uniref:Uncharacterized protein n=1 Tax=Clostridium saccharobutylicum DSM 13864 TaxID=1345695 RepID=U5N037_CLOSA|nr:hypothetical protein [Clostridium saccharobutylicum]AGX45142.1 hypothetical protein CLSA_c41820 [Clostridium saccharobutylicum DSM 13864]AQR92421.1 hypothetical protein CLOSC_41510 [Clostridium saccharobutylicum]AQS02324.1 hypothetical protein CSACC_41570 [Clostridium saccharobutylicum]AQS11928.1 hypothetical protein CLOBY_40860 [Clostridium saccharobutylicum]AQS16307.1 hypothetical protein CLOSACC_41570 [Clostridium saccharobutylicum]
MSINFKKFSPRPGIVNKQGRLPDPSELVCVEVPKVFDQCLIKRCLVYGEGPDTNTTDCELRSNPLKDPKRYIGSRDFNVKLISVEEIPNNGNPDFKKIILSYMISFYADYIDADGITKSELYEINRTDTIGKFYCPDSIAQISASCIHGNHDKDLDCNILKLEMVADALAGELLTDEGGNDVLDITLGYYIIVKCELVVQLLIPTYDYCPVPGEPCAEEEPEDVCVQFENAPVPKFYPDQNLRPLFSESDDDYEDDDYKDNN